MPRQPPTPKPPDSYALSIVLREYGCTMCQRYHREPESLFEQHIGCQSKHGMREIDVYTAIVEAAAVAAQK